MKKQLKQVLEFHTQTDSYFNRSPVSQIPDTIVRSRTNLIKEETDELIEAIQEGFEIDKLAKELADVLYVVYGTIVAYGLQDKFPEIFEAVHYSNMSKIAPDGSVVLNQQKSKVKKGKYYKKPDIKKILEQ